MGLEGLNHKNRRSDTYNLELPILHKEIENMPYLHLVLRVINLNLNINRAYETLVDKGLFENWLVIIIA